MNSFFIAVALMTKSAQSIVKGALKILESQETVDAVGWLGLQLNLFFQESQDPGFHGSIFAAFLLPPI